MAGYSNLTKINTLTKQHEAFFPLRVVGLAVELGHKLALQKGVLQVTANDLDHVHVSGTLQLTENGWLRKLRSYSLEVRKQDAENFTSKRHGERDCYEPARFIARAAETTFYLDEKRLLYDSQ